MPLGDGTSRAGRYPCGRECTGQVAVCPQARQELKYPLPIPFGSDHSISCHPPLPHSALGFSRHVRIARTREAWVCMVCQEHAGTLGSMVPMHSNCWCVLVHQLQCRREPPALCRVTLGPGAAVVHGVGVPLGLGSSRCGDSSPGGGVQAGWGWVTVISCPQAAAVVSCRCRGEGAGEQAGLPGGSCAPPGAGIVAVVCPSPRISAGGGWGSCSRGDA